MHREPGYSKSSLKGVPVQKVKGEYTCICTMDACIVNLSIQKVLLRGFPCNRSRVNIHAYVPSCEPEYSKSSLKGVPVQ